MKKFLFLSIILLICSTIQTSAQVRKNTKARPVKSVSIPQKNNTQDSKATSQPVKKIAIYSKTYSKGGSIFVGKKKIYYVEVENKNNAVKSIDCQTGAVETVIPGIAGIYEGAILETDSDSANETIIEAFNNYDSIKNMVDKYSDEVSDSKTSLAKRIIDICGK